jgi:hypothetical protein
VAPRFSQPGCHVTPVRGGGVGFAPKGGYCLVMIDDGQLVIVQPPDTVVDGGPVSGVELTTPALQRRVGTATFVRMNGHQWAIDFYYAAQAERLRSGGLGRKISVVFGFGWLASARLARQLNRQFIAALLEQGAAGRRSAATPTSLPASPG